jgi:hypothetical protein
MAILKSEFSLGNGRLKEIDALSFNTSSNVLSTGASNLLAFGAAGFSLSAHTFLSPAIATASAYIAGNDKIASKGYVDEAIAAVGPAGDPTLKVFAVAELANFALKDLVAIGASGLIRADKGDEKNSNVIGAVIALSGASGSGNVTVQLDGEVAVGDLAAFASGDLVWVGAAGGVTTYAALSANDYAVQAGIVSDVASDKIVLQPRIFGQVSA